MLLVHTAVYCIFSGLVVAKGGLLKLGRVSPLRQAKGASRLGEKPPWKKSLLCQAIEMLYIAANWQVKENLPFAW